MYESVRFISVPLYHCKSVKSKILPLNANIILPYLKNKNKPYFQQINTFLHSYVTITTAIIEATITTTMVIFV